MTLTELFHALYTTFTGILFVTFMVSFLLAVFLMPKIIKKLKKEGIVARDYHKKKTTFVASHGGVVVLLISLFTLTIIPIAFDMFIIKSGAEWKYMIIYAEIFVISIYSMTGILDDYVRMRRLTKVLICYTFAFPLLLIIERTTLIIPFGGYIELGLIFLYLIMPLYILVAANLVNMHSGLNGLQSGLSSIILITLLIKSFLIGRTGQVIAIASVAGAMAGFWIFNRYPSKIFGGNIGALCVGAAIGVAIVVQGFLVSGFIILIPHTVNFLLYVYWMSMRKIHPTDKRYKKAKYGKIRKDGTLKVPNPYTLKWILPYYFRVTEKEAVYAMYALTIIFCALGVMILY